MPGEKVIIRERKTFQNYVKTNPYVIVKVSATWCGPCKRCSPCVEKCYKQMPTNINMVVLDADDCADVCSYLKIKSVPTLITYVNGNPHNYLVSSNEDDIIDFFQQFLNGI